MYGSGTALPLVVFSRCLIVAFKVRWPVI